MAQDKPFCPDCLAQNIFRITMACCAVLIVACVIVPTL